MFEKTVFSNGVRLVKIPFKDTRAITVLFLFGVGSRFEFKQINGASHFIEHLMFKGTKKRPTTLDISKELDRVGAEFNAMTSKDYTGFYVKISREHQDLAVDILADILLNSKFENTEIKRERGVIIEEINMYHDNPLMYIDNLLEQVIFVGNSLAWDISGPVSVIKKISRKQLIDFRDTVYRPDNVIVAVSGKVSDELIKIVKSKYIDKLKKNKIKSSAGFKQFKINQNEPRIKLQYRKTKQVQLALGFPAGGYDDPDAYALHLLSIILGGNMSSRLFISVRERRGLCYFVRCYPNFYQEVSSFVVQSGLDITRLEEALGVIQQELRKIKNKGVTDRELHDATEFIRGKIVLNLEDSSNLAEYYAKQELLVGKILTPEQKMKKYEAVTVSDIQRVARKVFVREKFNLALIGPVKSKKKLFKQINI